jgi:hypothetical protein
VYITESPQKERLFASAPRVVVPTASNQMTPNSHGRLQTTPHSVVTPITPYHMIRRIAGPLNLSQDMLDETVQHANHVFSLPLAPSNIPDIMQPTKNEQIIIMHEMANAVKHSELITLLRYKIHWMRST